MNLWPLAPLAAAYGAATAARAACYRRGWLRTERVPVRVVSVGNIVAGGTGKTPMVALVARILRDAGLRPAIVSRGYGGRRAEDPLVVADGESLRPGVTAAQAGDEPVMLARSLERLPVVVARRRSEGARLAVEDLGARSLVLDDGFQHLALHRDLDIVLLDADRPFDNGRVLPAGYLRERPSALRRAHLLVLSSAMIPEGEPGPAAARDSSANPRERATGEGRARPDSAAEEALRRRARPGTPILRSYFQVTSLQGIRGEPSRPLGWLAGRKVAAFAGIARPDRLCSSLRRLGAEVAEFLTFPDHHRYTERDLAAILSRAKARGVEGLVTTEKDLARLLGTPLEGEFGRADLVALRGQAVLARRDGERLRDLLAAGGDRDAEGSG